MSTAQEEPQAARVAFWWTGLSVYVFWNAGTLIGALAGNAIDPEKLASTQHSLPDSWRWSFLIFDTGAVDVPLRSGQ